MNSSNKNLKWSSKQTVVSETYKNKSFEKAWMLKIRACLIGLVKCVRTFSNIRYSTVCNFADGFGMRLGNDLKCVKWFSYYWLIHFLVFVHLKKELRAWILEKRVFWWFFFSNFSSFRNRGTIDLNLTVCFLSFWAESLKNHILEILIAL